MCRQSQVAYLFTGKVNFRQKEERRITVATSCAGSWCGPLPPDDQPVFFFMEHKDGGLVLHSGACVQDFLVAPSLGQLGALRACFRKGLCGDAEKSAFR